MRTLPLVLVSVIWICGCGVQDDGRSIVARFDLGGGVLPMPIDVLRDDATGHLAIPPDAAHAAAAERALHDFYRSLDGWPSAMPATVELSGPVDAATADPSAVQVWEWDAAPHRRDDVAVRLDDTGTRLVIDPPPNGWARGAAYVAVVRGGGDGLRGRRGQAVEADVDFAAVRASTPSDRPALEALRRDLAPVFDRLASDGLPRDEIAALWRFTITTRVELAMDRRSQRVPLPFDLLLDPTTGRIDLPPLPSDSAAQTYTKSRLAEYDGFGTSVDLLFELSGPVDPATVTSQTVSLWQLSGPPGDEPRQLGVIVRVLADGAHVVIRPSQSPLPEKTRFAVVVSTGVRDRDGRPIVPMPVGHLLRAAAPVAAAGRSQLSSLDDAEAARIEGVRAELAPLFARLGRDDVVTAWPFTTMSIRDHLVDLAGRAARFDVPAAPRITRRMTAGEAAADFPIVPASKLGNVAAVYEGEIAVPYHLDPITRGWRRDDGHEIQWVRFTMTLPPTSDPERPVRTVMFGHHVVTDRRTMLTVADELARRGLAAIAIDLPFHGARTACVRQGPLCFANVFAGETVCPDPCELGTTCASDGRCVDGNGNGNHLARWPVLGFPVAAGAAFFDVAKISDIRDRIAQAIVEFGALSRSLRTADWRPLIGRAVERDRLYYAGMSIGSVIGATYVTLDPAIERAVLNVPGADTVDLFTHSAIFGPHVQLFLKQEHIEPGTYAEERFLNIARWLMDPVDPMHQAARIGRDRALIQMATLDFIIPNPYTKVLADLSGVPRRDYIAEHGFEIVLVEPEYMRGVEEMAGFLDGSFAP